uniref:Slc16a-28 n=1 Tax=Schmidtea mediterranea TaxID=79327 RepID=A0A0H3YK78_SCHMD|nr:slc16a-28 [Schmidtea mediterranea]
MKLVIVDSSKAWSVTIGCMIVNALMVGFIKIYSLIIIEYQDLLNAPMSLLMFGTSMLTSLTGLAAPLSAYLSERFTTMKTGIFASFLAVASIIMMAFSYNIYVQVTSAAFLGKFSLGLSFSIIYIPTISISGKCHIKHQNLSQGIITAGSSIGALIMPLGLSELINTYSIRGVMLIMAGVLFNFAVAAVLIPTHIIKINHGYKPVLIAIQDREKRSEGDIIKIGKWNVPIGNFAKKSKLKWPPRKLWRSVLLYSFGMTNSMNGFMLLCSLYGAFSRSLSITIQHSAYILIIQSSIDCATRIISGYLVDFKMISRWVLYCSSGFLLSIITILTGIFPSIPLFYFYLLSHAILGGILMMLHLLILLDVVGVDYITATFSFYVFIQGTMSLFSFYAVGYFCDKTGHYEYAICLSGAILALGALCIVTEHIFRSMQSRNVTL